MGKKESDIKKDVTIKNRRASFDYEFIDTFEAGIVLKGTEIKSIRMSNATLTDAFCLFIGSELFVRAMSISPYNRGNIHNHIDKADRKLLLKKRELAKLENHSKDTGITIIPVKLYINDRGFAKLTIALAKGKKLYDKRDSIKERDVRREMDRG